MIVMKYDPINGLAVPDGRCDETVNLLIASEQVNPGQDCVDVFSTENIFHAMRVATKQGRISWQEWRVVYNDTTFQFDKDGRLHSYAPNGRRWPEGFCDYQKNWLLKLL